MKRRSDEISSSRSKMMASNPERWVAPWRSSSPARSFSKTWPSAQTVDRSTIRNSISRASTYAPGTAWLSTSCPADRGGQGQALIDRRDGDLRGLVTGEGRSIVCEGLLSRPKRSLSDFELGLGLLQSFFGKRLHLHEPGPGESLLGQARDEPPPRSPSMPPGRPPGSGDSWRHPHRHGCRADSTINGQEFDIPKQVARSNPLTESWRTSLRRRIASSDGSTHDAFESRLGFDPSGNPNRLVNAAPVGDHGSEGKLPLLLLQIDDRLSGSGGSSGEGAFSEAPEPGSARTRSSSPSRPSGLPGTAGIPRLRRT
jgi:hypothetical protein